MTRVFRLSVDHTFKSLEVVPGQPAFDFMGLSNSASIVSTWHPYDVTYPEFIPHVYTAEECEFHCQEDIEDPSKKTVGDFPSFVPPALSGRALDVLGVLMSPAVEFLPLRSTVGQFTAFKVLRFVDALNVEASDIKWFHQLKREKDAGEPKHVEMIKRYAFYEDRIRNEVIFRIPQQRIHSFLFVTDRFRDAVMNADLKGFLFTQVWPPFDPVVERAKLEQRFRAKRLGKKGQI